MRKPDRIERRHEIVVGVDPGGEGAIALYRPNVRPLPPAPGIILEPAPALLLWDMPKKPTITANKKIKYVLDLGELRDLARVLVDSFGATRVIVEKVGGMPGQGSGFTFGWNVGVVHMAFVAAGMEPEVVTPGQWKKDCQVPADKKLAVQCAEATFPDYKSMFHVPHKTQKAKMIRRPDRAEAALIAWWGLNC